MQQKGTPKVRNHSQAKHLRAFGKKKHTHLFSYLKNLYPILLPFVVFLVTFLPLQRPCSLLHTKEPCCGSFHNVLWKVIDKEIYMGKNCVQENCLFSLRVSIMKGPDNGLFNLFNISGKEPCLKPVKDCWIVLPFYVKPSIHQESRYEAYLPWLSFTGHFFSQKVFKDVWELWGSLWLRFSDWKRRDISLKTLFK